MTDKVAMPKMRITVIGGWDLMQVIDAGIVARATLPESDSMNAVRQEAINQLVKKGVIRVEEVK